MRIPRIYTDQTLSAGQSITLGESASRHIVKVLRLKSGAQLFVFDGKGSEHKATLETMNKNASVVSVGEATNNNTESNLHITLAQGISRGERMDYTLQKAVELGVNNIIPIWTEHTQVRLNEERLEKRMAHWRGVIIHASEQSGRTIMPTLDTPRELNHWLAQSSSPALRLLLDPFTDNTLAKMEAPTTDIILLAGPEGGLSKAERTIAQQQGFIPIRLGPRVLRTETAALAAISGLQTLWGDFR